MYMYKYVHMQMSMYVHTSVSTCAFIFDVRMSKYTQFTMYEPTYMYDHVYSIYAHVYTVQVRVKKCTSGNMCVYMRKVDVYTFLYP